jgi:hypothetical protein
MSAPSVVRKVDLHKGDDRGFSRDDITSRSLGGGEPLHVADTAYVTALVLSVPYGFRSRQRGDDCPIGTAIHGSVML